MNPAEKETANATGVLSCWGVRNSLPPELRDACPTRHVFYLLRELSGELGEPRTFPPPQQR